MERSQATLIRRLFGDPPDKDAPKLQRLEYVRRMFLRLLPVNVIFWIGLLSQLPRSSALWILVAVSFAGWVCGLLSFELQIRRERKQPR